MGNVVTAAGPHPRPAVDERAVVELDPEMDGHHEDPVDKQVSRLGCVQDVGFAQGERDHPRQAVTFEREVGERVQARLQLLLVMHVGTYNAASAGSGVLPIVNTSYAEKTLARAVVVLGDVHAPDDDREDAALVIGTVLRRACPTEADLADLMSALGRALHVHLAIRRVLCEVQRLRPDTMVERAGGGVERLMEQAYQAGAHEALGELALVALEDERWARLLRDEWGKAAVAWAVSHLPESRYASSLLIGGWLHAFGRVPSWMRELAEEHPDLVTSTSLPSATRWTLHTAAPTVAGWHHLAGARGVPAAIEPALFGDKADVAVETLRVALGENMQQVKTASLEAWLRELTGTMP